MQLTMRRLGLVVSRYCGAQKVFRLASRGPVVLFYHGVEEKIEDPDVQQLHMPLRNFERQINFLRRHREIVSMNHLYECVTSGHRPDPKQVVLTFDDGYKNNAQTVCPLLQVWNIPFTVFISTQHISGHRRFGTYYVRAAIHHTRKCKIHISSIAQSFGLTTRASRLAAVSKLNQALKRVPQSVVNQIVEECIALLEPDEWSELNARFASDEPMNWQDVNYIHSSGGTIGSHCHEHCILHANQSDEVVYRQLRQSKETIEQNLAECRYFSFPNGKLEDVSPVAYAAVKSAQFQLCFSTIEGEFMPGVDCYFAPRFCATPDYEEFCYTLSQTGNQNRAYFESCRAIQTAS